MMTSKDIQVWIEPEWNWNSASIMNPRYNGLFESNQSGIETLDFVIVWIDAVTVWIEPEWNWNKSLRTCGTGSAGTFESNQSGIETDFFVCEFELCHLFESNQSGIETSPISRMRLYSASFESNQSGIETNVERKHPQMATTFESNQSGIETCAQQNRDAVTHGLNRTRVELKLRHLMFGPLFSTSLNRTRVELKLLKLLVCVALRTCVWIEPEWNWNVAIEYGLQSPIEVWIEPEWNWNRKCIALRENNNRVWIEPEWNWNTVASRCARAAFVFESNQSGIETYERIDVVQRKIGLNRTRVELKHTHTNSFPHRGAFVWIEPEWNWNAHIARTCLTPVRFESNQSGIETCAWRWWTAKRAKFESNQSGIETTGRWITRRRDGRLNRTRVELKLCVSCFPPFVVCGFESNQSGIETFDSWRSLHTPSSVWIEPEWNWNVCCS